MSFILKNIPVNTGLNSSGRVSLKVPRESSSGWSAPMARERPPDQNTCSTPPREEGRVRVLRARSVAQPVEVLSRFGYLSEDRDLPPWMSVGEVLRYNPAFYPGWDTAYAESLREQFHLSPSAIIRTLSKGELAKAGLLVALAHRPELLVLDEPSSGLDPIVRRELLEAVVRSVVSEGRTVLFSSHLLDEIARVSDQWPWWCKDGWSEGSCKAFSNASPIVSVCRSRRAVRSFPWALSITGGPENGRSSAKRLESAVQALWRWLREVGRIRGHIREFFHAGREDSCLRRRLWPLERRRNL